MGEIKNNVLELIGNTPLVRLNKVGAGLEAEIIAKVECFNPGGSVKDRIGVSMIADAEKKGLLKPGGTIVEGTSGNTGMGLAIAAAIKGYKCIFVMPDKMSMEKIRNLRAFGAKVVITPTAVEPDDPRSYYQVSRRIAQETRNPLRASVPGKRASSTSPPRHGAGARLSPGRNRHISEPGLDCMDEAFSSANLLQWLSPCRYPTDTADEIMRILSRREGASATTIMRQQRLAA